MNRPISTTVKLAVLIALASVFSATMIFLSVRNGSAEEHRSTAMWGDTKNIDRVFPVHAGNKLVINVDAGDVNITGRDGEELSVTVKMKGSGERLANYKIDMDQVNDVVTIEGRDKNHHWNFFDGGWFDVKFEIKLPRSFNIELTTSGGDVAVHNVEGTIDGNTSGGDIKVGDVGGTVRLTTSGGDVEIRKATGDLTFTTSGGDIKAENAQGTLHLETSGGDIKLYDIDADLNASTSGGNISAELQDNKGIELETSGGDISVTVPNSITADVDAETIGGDVDCELEFSGKLKNGEMHGTINGGGKSIRARTSGGDIKIKGKHSS